MTTTPGFSHSLFTTPFDHTTDFTALADNCERFVDVLVECEDPAQKMALCGRLSACLALLQPTLLAHTGRHRAAVKKPGGASAYPAYNLRFGI